MKRTIIGVCIVALLAVSVTLWARGTREDAPREVQVLAAMGGDEAIAFGNVLQRFTEETGIPVMYDPQSGDTVITTANTRIASGARLDVLTLSRPGNILEWADDGHLVALNDGDNPLVPTEMLHDNFSQSWLDLVAIDGRYYGVPLKAFSKSVVWHRPASFEQLGLEYPETWQEWMQVAEVMADEGRTPFVISGAEAWTLTDWFENIYARVAGPDKYNDLFIRHGVSWTDPTVVEAMEYFRQVLENDEWIALGRDGAIGLSRDEAMGLVLQDPPQGEMFYLAGFMDRVGRANFPHLTSGEDYSFFPFPQIQPEWGNVVVGGGDHAIAFNDSPEVRELMRFLSKPETAEYFGSQERGAVISPNTNASRHMFTGAQRLEAEQIDSAEVFLFDGSDMAPGAVGGDAMFTALQDFLMDPSRLMESLEYIEAAAQRAY